jgi:hypothetical protein
MDLDEDEAFCEDCGLFPDECDCNEPCWECDYPNVDCECDTCYECLEPVEDCTCGDDEDDEDD